MTTAIEKKLMKTVADFDTNTATQLLFIAGLRTLLGVDRDRAIEMAKGFVAIAAIDQRRHVEKTVTSLISEMMVEKKTTGQEGVLITEFERSKHVLMKSVANTI